MSNLSFQLDDTSLAQSVASADAKAYAPSKSRNSAFFTTPIGPSTGFYKANDAKTIVVEPFNQLKDMASWYKLASGESFNKKASTWIAANKLMASTATGSRANDMSSSVAMASLISQTMYRQLREDGRLSKSMQKALDRTRRDLATGAFGTYSNVEIPVNKLVKSNFDVTNSDKAALDEFHDSAMKLAHFHAMDVQKHVDAHLVNIGARLPYQAKNANGAIESFHHAMDSEKLANTIDKYDEAAIEAVAKTNDLEKRAMPVMVHFDTDGDVLINPFKGEQAKQLAQFDVERVLDAAQAKTIFADRKNNGALRVSLPIKHIRDWHDEALKAVGSYFDSIEGTGDIEDMFSKVDAPEQLASFHVGAALLGKNSSEAQRAAVTADIDRLAKAMATEDPKKVGFALDGIKATIAQFRDNIANRTGRIIGGATVDKEGARAFSEGVATGAQVRTSNVRTAAEMGAIEQARRNALPAGVPPTPTVQVLASTHDSTVAKSWQNDDYIVEGGVIYQKTKDGKKGVVVGNLLPDGEEVLDVGEPMLLTSWRGPTAKNGPKAVTPFVVAKPSEMRESMTNFLVANGLDKHNAYIVANRHLDDMRSNGSKLFGRFGFEVDADDVDKFELENADAETIAEVHPYIIQPSAAARLAKKKPEAYSHSARRAEVSFVDQPEQVQVVGNQMLDDFAYDSDADSDDESIAPVAESYGPKSSTAANIKVESPFTHKVLDVGLSLANGREYVYEKGGKSKTLQPTRLRVGMMMIPTTNGVKVMHYRTAVVPKLYVSGNDIAISGEILSGYVDNESGRKFSMVSSDFTKAGTPSGKRAGVNAILLH